MKIYIALMIILCSASLASAANFNLNDIEWGANVSGTLYKGNTLTNGEYMVKAVEFTAPAEGTQIIVDNNQKKIVPETRVVPMVYLEIYKNGNFMGDVALSFQSSTYVDPNYEVKVTATEFLPVNATEWVMEYYKPWAKISIQKRGEPLFEVTYKLAPNKTVYFNGDVFIANVTIKNSGEGFAKNADVNLDIGPLRLLSSNANALHQNYYNLAKGASQSFEVMLSVPVIYDEKEFNLSLNEKFYDAKNIEYIRTNSTPITISPALINVSKTIKNRVYLKDTPEVQIVVLNTGTFDIHNIHINDTLNENFGLKSDTPLEWDIPLLKPGQDWRKTYSVKPLEANLNGFTIPPANASFVFNNKPYIVSSQTNTVIVNGPKIILNKTVNRSAVNIGEFVRVSISVKNIGNIGTRYEVTDSLPENVSLAEGATSITNWSEPNTQQVFSYTIRMNKAGKVELPATVANYTNVEYKGTTRAVLSSDKPVITVNDPSKVSLASSNDVPTPEPTPNPTIVIPGFKIVIGFSALLFAAALRRRSR
jgi:uncharacterized repeat protein (TIGR01451 family)